MSLLKPPEPLSLTGNVPENWRRFQQRYLLYQTSAGFDNKTNKEKTSLFLHTIGDSALEVYNTFEFENENAKFDFEIVTGKFAEYCNPRKNVAIERHKFFSHNQTTESLDQYITELKHKAQSCEFGEQTSSLIRDRIVSGIIDKSIKERLLRTTELTLEKALTICHAAESVKNQLKDFEGEQNVHKIKVQNKYTEKYEQKGYRNYNGNQSVRPKQAATKNEYQCKKCGYQHGPKSCPAFGKNCRNCNGYNHFAKQCKTRNMFQPKQTYKTFGNKTHPVQVVEDEDTREYFIGMLANENKSSNWVETLFVNGKEIKMKLDTGAQVNVISYDNWLKIKNEETLKNSSIRVTGYGGSSIPIAGEVKLDCTYREKNVRLTFIVTQLKADTILGASDCEKLGLIKRIEEVSNEYQEIFRKNSKIGIGCLKEPYHIEIEKDAIPIVNPPRRIPEAIREKLESELKHMMEFGIIEEVKGHSDWVHNIVIVEKPGGKIRVCLDPRDLNKVIKRNHYCIPTVEEIAATLKGSQYFSVLDADCGFWQVPLTEESSNLCTFTTPFGRYKFKRLPFGISAAPEIFQKTLDTVFKNVPGVVAYFDDVLVRGSTKEEHDLNLVKALRTARDANLGLNYRKCRFGLTSVIYLGHLFTKDGVRPDPSKVKAIIDMPSPSDRSDLERFLGMTTYLAKFLPKLSESTAELRRLLKKDINWHWTDRHEADMAELRKKLTTTPVLQYFDPNKPTIVSVDASMNGLGAVLLQEDGPIAYASRMLSETEKNYAQIEKETLAIVFGCERFHHYIYGREVVVETDHRPLESIFKKQLACTPPRIQRFRLRLQRYQILVTYKRGKDLILADTLSRAYLPENDHEQGEAVYVHQMTEEEVEMHVQFAINSISASKHKLEEFKREIGKSEELKQLKATILEGWPKTRCQVPEEIKEYWNFREELTVLQGLIFKGQRLLVPASMRSQILQQLHHAHLGIEKTTSRARQGLFWIGMRKDIEKLVTSCEKCNENKTKNSKEPLIPVEIPEGPWQKVGVDIFQFKEQTYLLTVDYYSKYPEIALLQTTTSTSVIVHLKSIFARHGIPKVLISDNGPQFSAKEFAKFAEEWDIDHITSSPLYPKANGMAERTIQTIKNMLKKTADPYLALLEWRNTPVSDSTITPAMLLMGRTLRSTIPVKDKLLKPVKVNHQFVKNKLRKNQETQKRFYDRGAKKLSELVPGERIRMEKEGRWIPGTIVKKTINPRSYIVTTSSGNYRRNRVHLRSTKEDPKSIDPFLEDLEEEHLENAQRGQADVEDQMRNPVIIQLPPDIVQQHPQQNMRTRSGREVKLPVRFKD